MFIAACCLVVTGALLAEAKAKEGILIVPAGVWYAILAGLGLWLLALAE